MLHDIIVQPYYTVTVKRLQLYYILDLETYDPKLRRQFTLLYFSFLDVRGEEERLSGVSRLGVFHPWAFAKDGFMLSKLKPQRSTEYKRDAEEEGQREHSKTSHIVRVLAPTDTARRSGSYA